MFKIEVLVKPNSKQQKIIQITENSYEICLKSKPERGKANKELIKLLADYFELSQNQIRIVQGLKTKRKIIEIEK